MKRKKLVMIGIIFFSTWYMFAENIILAPLVCYDENNKIIELTKNPNKIINRDLSKVWFEGIINFSAIDEKNYGLIYTIVDAERLCVVLNSDYIVYGYIQKNELSWYGNLKLYDANRKQIVKDFFASDSIDNFNRFITVLEQNLVSGIEEILGIDFLNEEVEKNRPTEIRIPISACYWTPIDYKWSNVITGITGVNTGIEIFPPFQTKTFNNTLVDVSATLKLSYAYGIGSQKKYPLDYHTVTVCFPVSFYFHFTEKHSTYFGAGFFYELELMNVQKKYENPQFMYQNMFGTTISAGYEFLLNNFCSIYTEICLDYHFAADSYIAVKPSLGIKIYAFRGE